MKTIITIILCLTLFALHGQESNTGFDGHKWEAPYSLAIPKDWTIERFLIPISFAPQIRYKGVEDIRFAPGWAKADSDEYWTYAFLWYLDGAPETDEKIVARNLKAYYTGLIEANAANSKIPVDKSIPVRTAFKEAPTDKGDLKTYNGSIMMMDYMSRKSIQLHCIVHLKYCADENKTILFHELSPKPITHQVWLGLNQLWLGFACKKM